jgi:phosphoribosylformylglycinamidine cyclo-ligase
MMLAFMVWYIVAEEHKILHFVENLHIIKTIYSVPPLFKLIQEQSKTDWKEMYKFLTVDTVWKYTFLNSCQDIIAISKSFNVDAQIGRVEAADTKN